MRSNYKVPFRNEEAIATLALQCRRDAENENLARFNIIEFVEHVLPRVLKRLKKGTLEIELFSACGDEKLAKVILRQGKAPILRVDKEIWDLAVLGEPDAKFIIAHEVGHLVLHDHYAQAFSIGPVEQGKFVQEEEQSEWQANTFASYFLIPRRVLAAFPTSEELARCCEVPRWLSDQRFAAALEEQRRSERRVRAKAYTGDSCGDCGSFTMLPDGIFLRCDTCGKSTKYVA